jgi:hypothetical protein
MKYYFTRAIPFVLLGWSFAFSYTAHAQFIVVDSVTHWKKAFRAGVNLNQATFSGNWKAGGVNSLGFNTFLNYKANYLKGKRSFDNEIDLLYGMVNNTGQGYRKTLDRIFLDTKYGHSLSKVWDLFVAANVQSQFAKGYKYGTDSLGRPTQTLISGAISPTYLTAALGFEYHPTDYFKLRLSPMAPRITYVNDVKNFVTTDNPRPYGVDPTRNVRFEWFAFQMLAEFNKDIAQNINLKWRYVMYVNYETLALKTIDHRLDINLSAKVNKYINVNLGGILLYDYNQDKKIQISEAFSLGVLYSFQNYVEKK